MIRTEKEKQVNEIEEKIRGAKITIFSNFCGLNVREMENLRHQFREAHVEYKVYKNTLIQRAFKGSQEITEFLSEPTALAFSYDDISAPAKILVKFAKDKPALKIKGGLIEGKVMDKSAVGFLAELPSREMLLTQLVMGIQSPLRGFINVINGSLVKLVMVLKAIETNKSNQK